MTGEALRESYDRADRFLKGIRKLAAREAGGNAAAAANASLLDRLRLLVTQVGNAVAFVRMLRSGALTCAARSVAFVPDLDDELPSFSQLCKEEPAFAPAATEGQVDAKSEQLLAAAGNLDQVLATLGRNFSQASDYFKLLVRAFAPSLRKAAHFAPFFVLVPPLSLCFVEHAIAGKERMVRASAAAATAGSRASVQESSATVAAFTDDGFVMGIAYLLRLLDQVADFESLHWFAGVRARIEGERSAVAGSAGAAAAAAGAGAQSPTPAHEGQTAFLTQTTSLTLKRLALQQREFELLRFNLTSCHILFRGADDPEPPAADGDASETQAAPPAAADEEAAAVSPAVDS